MPEHALAHIIEDAPTSFGVYIFKDKRKRPLYIGKAKNIRKRLRSYFAQGATLDLRKQEMVHLAHDISYIVTENELEALALEANLIKQDRPKYNILLRDDKNYPYLRIDMNDEWPFLEVVRKLRNDGALYFGPYIPAGAMHETLALIRKYFTVRLCKYDLSRVSRPCVQHQMGKCLAPCAGNVSRNEYMKAVEDTISFLKGKDKRFLSLLREQMLHLSEQEMYEEAALVRDRIAAIERIWDKQKVVSPRLGETDVIGISVKGNNAAFVVLFIRNGIMTGSKEFFLSKVADMPPGELLHGFLETLYAGPLLPPSTILVPFSPDDTENLSLWLSNKKEKKVTVTTAQKGLKKDLLDMATENAAIFADHYKAKDHESVLQEVQELLGLERLPGSISVFDISTLHGSDSLGACVIWEYGHFQKQLYRFVKIKTVKGMDDFAMMRETVRRILNRMGSRIPDLVIVDGGKGQLDAAHKAIYELVLEDPPDIVSIAKDPDRVFAHWLEHPVNIENSRQSSLFLKRLRDESHRYVITQHRKARKSRLLTSSLEEIKGIGKKRRLALLKHFGSLDAIREASLDEIAHVEGFNASLAGKVKEFLSGS